MIFMWGWVLLEGVGHADALVGEGKGFGVEGEGEVRKEAGLGEGFGCVALAASDFEIGTGLEVVREADGDHIVEEGDGFGEAGGRGILGVDVLGEEVGEVDGDDVVQGVGVAGGEDVADVVEGGGGVVEGDEVAAVAVGVGEGVLGDVGDG